MTVDQSFTRTVPVQVPSLPLREKIEKKCFRDISIDGLVWDTHIHSFIHIANTRTQRHTNTSAHTAGRSPASARTHPLVSISATPDSYTQR